MFFFIWEYFYTRIGRIGGGWVNTVYIENGRIAGKVGLKGGSTTNASMIGREKGGAVIAITQQKADGVEGVLGRMNVNHSGTH